MFDVQILRGHFPEKPRGNDRGRFQGEDAGARWGKYQGENTHLATVRKFRFIIQSMFVSGHREETDLELIFGHSQAQHGDGTKHRPTSLK